MGRRGLESLKATIMSGLKQAQAEDQAMEIEGEDWDSFKAPSRSILSLHRHRGRRNYLDVPQHPTLSMQIPSLGLRTRVLLIVLFICKSSSALLDVDFEQISATSITMKAVAACLFLSGRARDTFECWYHATPATAVPACERTPFLDAHPLHSRLQRGPVARQVCLAKSSSLKRTNYSPISFNLLCTREGVIPIRWNS